MVRGDLLSCVGRAWLFQNQRDASHNLELMRMLNCCCRNPANAALHICFMS